MDYEKLNNFLTKTLQVEHHNILITSDEVNKNFLFDYIYDFYNAEEIRFATKDGLALRNGNVIDLKKDDNEQVVYHDTLRLEE